MSGSVPIDRATAPAFSRNPPSLSSISVPYGILNRCPGRSGRRWSRRIEIDGTKCRNGKARKRLVEHVIWGRLLENSVVF